MSAPQLNTLTRLIKLSHLKSQSFVHLNNIATLNVRLSSTTSTANVNNTGQSLVSKSSDEIAVINRKGILTLRLNRPDKKNAISISMYDQIRETFSKAATDDNVKMVLVTGTGDYYSSGNDLASGFGSGMLKSLRAQLQQKDGNSEIKLTPETCKMADESAQLAEQFVNSIIDFPKPLFAVVNGPAFGIMVTTLGLCDNVICSDKAIFVTPFLSTSQVPEACSSYTFPRIMGTSRANSLLLFNQTLTAQEAYNSGLVSKVVPHEQLDQYVESLLFDDKKGLASFESTITWTKGKPLIRDEKEKELLRKVNHKECQEIAETWKSPDFAKAMLKFFNRKK
ncbi:enoyl-CoA delta isomerase 3, peroxisomal-like [Tetranychus urticae]|uniref:enoyl-CoA delta isomerase 3, peroxisomal-like n=1 Tax=Tetranychus urticae TaxID=32264 RepID=UPI00077BC331|nr:enoyl-CoA delta isomerase 3, peroxisomal-like [Tetranychus urticae]